MEYPELEKMMNVKSESHSIGAFLEWMSVQGIILAELDQSSVLDPYPQQLVPVHISINDLLAKYFDIDLKKVEQEKRQILASIREEESKAGFAFSFLNNKVVDEAMASVSMDREGDGQTIALGPVTVGDPVRDNLVQRGLVPPTQVEEL